MYNRLGQVSFCDEEDLRSMKKWMLMISVLAAAGALSACTPTQVQPAGYPVEESTEEYVDYKLVGQEPVDPMDMAAVYRLNNGAIERVMLDVEEMTEQYLTDRLIEFGVLDEGTEVLSFEVEGDMGAGPGNPDGGESERIGTLNLSKVPAWSADQEELMLRCVGNTFLDNFQLDKLKLLVNGENYSGAGITLGDDDYLEYESGYKNVVE